MTQHKRKGHDTPPAVSLVGTGGTSKLVNTTEANAGHLQPRDAHGLTPLIYDESYECQTPVDTTKGHGQLTKEEIQLLNVNRC